MRIIIVLILNLILVLNSTTSGQKSLPIKQVQGEAIINALKLDIEKKYPEEKQTNLLELFYYKAPEGVYVLLKGTDLIIKGKEEAGIGILELYENSLSGGVHFANTDDPLSALANFPAHPKYRNKICELLKSPNAAVRVGALLTLARMPHASLVSLLEKSLYDENLDVRLAAIIAFGPTEHYITSTFILESQENMQMAKRSIEQQFPLPITLPYHTTQVETILTKYLNTPVRVKDMPAVLNTLVNLEMKKPILKTARIHSYDSSIEKFMKQCYEKLEKMP